MWKATKQNQKAPPYWAKLQGQSRESTEGRQKFKEELDKRLIEGGEGREWNAACKAAQEVGEKVLGLKPKKRPMPWLEGKQEEMKRKDYEIAEAEERWRTTGDADKAYWQKQKGKAKRSKRRMLRAWERLNKSSRLLACGANNLNTGKKLSRAAPGKLGPKGSSFFMGSGNSPQPWNHRLL